MIFNSVTFICFLTISLLFFWLIKNNYKNYFLLIISCIFYGFWRWEYLIVILIAALTDYFISLLIYNTPAEKANRKKILLITTIFINLGILFYFKYFNFFIQNSNSILSFFNINININFLKILLPFGISFYTFETISYTIDVYRGLIKPEKSFLKYALFITFFPKLVAGPIQRASELIPQFNQSYKFNFSNFAYGTKRVLYGLFLKVVVADNISGIVNESFSMNFSNASAIDVITMAFLFGYQIYFDFSAYSHIALGTASLFNISIPENFDFPYMAKSLKSFWKKWHISLSAWIRDYLYLPLSGIEVNSSSGKSGIGSSLDNTQNKNTISALFLTWAIMGFWHGANWTFLFWGLYHASFIYIERRLIKFRSRVYFFQINVVNWFVTLFVVMLSWIPFRVSNLNDTFILYSKLFSIKNYTFLSLRENSYLVCFCLTILFILTYAYDRYIKAIIAKNNFIYFLFEIVKYFIIIFLVFIFLKPINQFIYFQF